MLSGISERLEDLTARLGLGGLPAPVALAALAFAAGALVWAGMRWVPVSGPEIAGEESTVASGTGAGMAASGRAGEATPASQVTVHVVGAVRRPGVYRLPAGSRGEDALKAAGGALANADPAALNLARVLQDGEQLQVPAKGEVQAAQAGAGQGASGGAAAVGAKVDINRATAEQLDALPGVGPATAAKIVQEREANGPYRSVDDLMRVPGIGPKKLDALKDLVSVG